MQSTFFPNKGKSLEQAVAIRVVGNTAPTGGIADGKYVFLKGHSTLPDGGYKANGAIQAGATLTSSNLTATSQGFVNDAYSALSSDLGSPSSASGVTGNDAFSKISTLNSKITKRFYVKDSTTSDPVQAIRNNINTIVELVTLEPFTIYLSTDSLSYLVVCFCSSANYATFIISGYDSNPTMIYLRVHNGDWQSLNIADAVSNLPTNYVSKASPVVGGGISDSRMPSTNQQLINYSGGSIYVGNPTNVTDVNFQSTSGTYGINTINNDLTTAKSDITNIKTTLTNGTWETITIDSDHTYTVPDNGVLYFYIPANDINPGYAIYTISTWRTVRINVLTGFAGTMYVNVCAGDEIAFYQSSNVATPLIQFRKMY